MIIKKKSLIVAIISSYVISMVLILTLVGYVVYIEIRKENSTRAYEYQLQKVKAKYYAKFLLFPKLNATIGSAGALTGRPVIDGVIENTGIREISDLLVKVKFIDKDDAVIYEVIFRPQEPSLGSSTLSQVGIPYITTPSKILIKPGGTLAFKKILTDCPEGIVGELKKNPGFAKGSAKWSGKFLAEPISLNFQE